MPRREMKRLVPKGSNRTKRDGSKWKGTIEDGRCGVREYSF